MRERSTWRRIVIMVAVLALGLAACPAEDDDTPDIEEGEAPEDPEEVSFDIGVTDDPCPDAVNEDNGCIYVGTLSDLTVGPFATFGEQIVRGQQAFWQHVNEQGGVGGLFDVHMADHIEDTEYNPEQHVSSYQRISGDVAALTQTLGTPPTLAVVEQMDADDMVGAVLTWWSGWEMEEYDHILQAGSNYCIDGMNGVEWAVEEHGIESVVAVFFPNDYGLDASAGVRIAAEELGIELITEFEQVPTAAGGETSGAVQAILSGEPDLVFLTVGPTELAEIVGGAAAQGFQGRFVTSHPGYADALLETPAGEAIIGLLNVVAPHENFTGESEAHQAMQEQVGEGERPGNDGFTYGWVAAYPVLSALERAVEQGDLTRAGIREAASDMTVDHEGALPDKQYGGEPNETVVRSTTIAQPDPEDLMGLATIEQRFEGSVAGEFDFTEPCVPIG
jgi:ABC-type branched-subunit amino acid transport system substrate-binding protein